MSNRDTTVDSSKATELLKEMLKLSSTPLSSVTASNSTFQSSGMAVSSSAASNSLFNAALNAELSPTKSYVNGKSSEMALISADQAASVAEQRQRIVLTANEETVSYAVYGSDVDVLCHKYNHTSGSSKVKIKNIVNSVWEVRYYYGQLVSAHLNKNYIAYAIKIPTSDDGAVRVISRKTSDRLLLRGMRGLVVDVSFAHILNEVILGAVDEHGNVFVYSIKQEHGLNLYETIILEVRRSDMVINKSRLRRLIWCPYLPEEQMTDEEADIPDSAKMMVITYAIEAEIWSVDTVSREYGCGPLYTETILGGYQHIKEHNLAVTDAALPPDGTALATTSDDGSIKFYQLNNVFDNREPLTCLHNWIPHDGKPLSCLFFLDNKKNPPSENIQYWNYAITGCNQNRELKVWNCASWKCFQTIKFESPDDVKLKPELIARLDESAEFLILSNITHRVLYVLHIYQDKEKGIAKIDSISEFPVAHPVLSFDILDVSRKKFRQNSENDDFSYNDQMGDESPEEKTKDDLVDGIVVTLVYVQPKSLQECVIAFQPTFYHNVSTSVSVNLTQDSLYFKDKLADASFDFNQSDSSYPMNSSAASTTADILLTPDVFTLPASQTASPVKSVADRSLVNLDDLPSPKNIQMSSTVNDQPSVQEQDDTKKRDSLKSTGSSPSLEVQEILNKSLAEDVEVNTSSDAAAAASGVNENSTSLLMDSNENGDELVELISLVKQEPQKGSTVSSVAFSTSMTAIPCIPDDFTNKEIPTGWPATTSLPQHPMDEDLVSQSTAKSPKAPQSNHFDHDNRLMLERVLASVVTMTQSMQNVLRVLDNQQGELGALKESLIDVQSGRLFSKQMKVLANSQKDLTSSLKILLEKHHHAETSIIGNILKSHDEKSINLLAQVASNNNVGRLEQVVKLEFQNSVLPLMTREMKQMETAIHSEFTRRLATTDSLLRDNLHKLVESKTFLSGVSGSMATALQGCIRNIFQDLVQNSLLPTFEKLCQNMFIQINEAFRSGTKDYTQQLEVNLDKDLQQTQDLVNSQLQGVISKLQTSTEQMTSSVGFEINRQLQATLKRFEEELAVRVKEQMLTTMKEHETVIGNTVVNAIRSRTVTPVPTDFQINQTQVMQLVQQGQINAAFKQALSVNDLSLVMHLCEKVSPSQVFGRTPCPLQPPVLLALISQLSADLESHTELKHEYLKEAVVNLDLSDPITCSHSPRVLDSLKNKLQAYILTHPTNKISKDIRLLLMATTSFLKPNLA
ncbi:enhancer of mRNA decapping 4 [Chamberlinius hualienensis]